MVVVLIVARSPVGTAFQGIRESEERMRALGYNTFAYKAAAYVLAAAVATLGGIVSAYYSRFVSTHDVGVLLSGYGLLVVILGGSGTLLGPVIGSVIFVLMQNVVSSYTERWMMILGGIFVAVMIFAPNGLMGLIGRPRPPRWLTRRIAS
jgi:branched-chain amino acid transport system permease protein